MTDEMVTRRIQLTFVGGVKLAMDVKLPLKGNTRSVVPLNLKGSRTAAMGRNTDFNYTEDEALEIWANNIRSKAFISDNGKLYSTQHLISVEIVSNGGITTL